MSGRTRWKLLVLSAMSGGLAIFLIYSGFCNGATDKTILGIFAAIVALVLLCVEGA